MGWLGEATFSEIAVAVLGLTAIPVGEFVQVRVTEQMDYDLVGELEA